MRNVDIKARVRDLDGFSARLKALRPSKPRVLVQDDVFFLVPRGRLKLRTLGPKTGELIFYDRPDKPGPKACAYDLFRTAEPGKLRDVLAAALGVRGIVRKVRLVSMVGQIRVHLDDVAGLGLFAELEVVLRPNQTLRSGIAVARGLMKKLGIGEGDLVSGAYLDLLENKARSLSPCRRGVNPSARPACGRKPSGNSPSA